MRPKQFEGQGGYGAIWTLNQDQRQGIYHPHKTVSKRQDRIRQIVTVKCLDCGEDLSHLDIQGPPSKPCRPRRAETIRPEHTRERRPFWHGVRPEEDL